MTIASAITAAQGRVADCYTSVSTMGGTLPVTQNLTNLPAAIESIPLGGGGDTIYLVNASGSTVSAGQKVLCNLGTIGSDTPTTLTGNIGGDNNIFFFDNDTFAICGNLNSGTRNSLLAERIDGAWTTSTSPAFNTSTIHGIVTYDTNGLTNLSATTGTASKTYLWDKTGTSIGVVSGTTNYRYLGEYDNTHYVMKYNSTSAIAPYDIANNSAGTAINPTSTKFIFGKIIGDKCVLWSASNYIYVYSVASTGFTSLNSTLATTALYPLYVTGTSAGDYILCTDITTNYTTFSTNPPVSHLFCYQIQSDYSVIPVTVPALAMFETKPCLVCFDNRNNVLSVATDDNVYFYEYADGIFRNMNVVLDTLPPNTDGYNYRTMMSPDKKTIVITLPVAASDVYLYTLTTADHKIVKNSALNYQLATSLTGYATGNTDSSGRYEVQTVLPSAVDYVLGTDLEPDETTIYGGVE